MMSESVIVKSYHSASARLPSNTDERVSLNVISRRDALTAVSA